MVQAQVPLYVYRVAVRYHPRVVVNVQVARHIQRAPQVGSRPQDHVVEPDLMAAHIRGERNVVRGEAEVERAAVRGGIHRTSRIGEVPAHRHRISQVQRTPALVYRGLRQVVQRAAHPMEGLAIAPPELQRGRAATHPRAVVGIHIPVQLQRSPIQAEVLVPADHKVVQHLAHHRRIQRQGAGSRMVVGLQVPEVGGIGAAHHLGGAVEVYRGGVGVDARMGVVVLPFPHQRQDTLHVHRARALVDPYLAQRPLPGRYRRRGAQRLVVCAPEAYDSRSCRRGARVLHAQVAIQVHIPRIDRDLRRSVGDERVVHRDGIAHHAGAVRSLEHHIVKGDLAADGVIEVKVDPRGAIAHGAIGQRQARGAPDRDGAAQGERAAALVYRNIGQLAVVHPHRAGDALAPCARKLDRGAPASRGGGVPQQQVAREGDNFAARGVDRNHIAALIHQPGYRNARIQVAGRGTAAPYKHRVRGRRRGARRTARATAGFPVGWVAPFIAGDGGFPIIFRLCRRRWNSAEEE